MKRIISLLIILSMCFFACSVKQESSTDISATQSTAPSVNPPEKNNSGIDENKSAAENLYSLFSNTLDKGNATIELRSEGDGKSVSKADLWLDILGRSFVLKYSERHGLMNTKVNNVRLGFKDGILYNAEQNETGVLHGSLTALNGEGKALSLFGTVVPFSENEERDLPMISKALAAFILCSDKADITVDPIFSKLKDDKWVEETLKLTLTEEGERAVFKATLDIYTLYTEITELLKDGMTEDDRNEALSRAEGYKGLALSVTLIFSDGILTEADVKLNADSVLRFYLSDHGNTVVPVDELISALNEAHNGHTECVACGDKVYYSCYCYSCANKLLCANFCGNPRDKKSEYCADCYKPCRECNERQSEYNGYCDACYHLYYCNEDCGRLLTRFAEKCGYGYCDECFKACKRCGEHNRDKNSEYCYACQKMYFCGVCGVNSISRRFDSVGYCNDCYAPCPRCRKQGAEEYEGYCLACFNEKYCNICQKNLITHDAKYGGFCDDCFNPCTNCKKHNFSKTSKLCFECEAPFCFKCRENPVTRTASNGNGYCDGCYVACRECRKDMCALIDKLCYECYYNKYCHRCGKNEITHGEGPEHKVCDECYN